MRLAAVVLAALTLTLAATASAGSRPTLAQLEGELMCPVCKTPLDQSDSPIATRMKQQIQRWIDQGLSESQIKARLVAQFGPAVLAEPTKRGFDLVAWVLPIAGIVAGALVLAALARRWSRGRPGPAVAAGPPLDPELDRRLDEELARFDA
jgi:cytochrome c-type biogenesis protein CcmH